MDTTQKEEQSSTQMIDVLIVGTGIGGLISALCFYCVDYRVVVYERLSILEPIGFGLNLQPFAAKLFYELGLKREMDEVIGIRTSTTLFYSRKGQLIYDEKRRLDSGYKWLIYSVHHVHFQQLLLRCVGEGIDENCVRLGQKLIDFRSDGGYVEADFVNPLTGDRTTAKANVLLGADGIKSSVLRILCLEEGNLLRNGSTIYRAVTETE